MIRWDKLNVNKMIMNDNYDIKPVEITNMY